MTFTSPLASFANSPLPSTASPENLLAAFWDDLVLDTFSYVIYHSNGERFVVQFDGVYRAGGGGPYTFEVILHRSGAITYQYLSMSPPLTSATIGIQNAARDEVIKFGFLAAGSLALVSPNPLNPQAKLTFVTTEPGAVSAQLFDLSGRLVRNLLPQQYFMPGAHEVTVDGRNEQGNRLASGVYYYRLLSVDGISKGAVTVLK